MRPHSSRVRSRSSRRGICFGGRSDDRTIWPPAPWSELKVWKNSSWSCWRAFQELDVVDEEDVDLAVAAPEGVRGVVPDRVDELVHERLGRDVPDSAELVHVAHVVPDRVQEVGLAQSGRAVDEERVVGAGRGLGDRERGGVGEAVRRADDEVLERVAGVQRGPARRGGIGRGRRRGRWRAGVAVAVSATAAAVRHEDGLVEPGAGLDREVDDDVVAGDLVDHGGDEAAVVGADPLADHRVGGGEAEALAVEIGRPHVPEPRVPGGFGQLLLQRGGRRSPELGGGSQAPVRNFHSPIHRCGEPLDPPMGP